MDNLLKGLMREKMKSKSFRQRRLGVAGLMLKTSGLQTAAAPSVANISTDCSGRMLIRGFYRAANRFAADVSTNSANKIRTIAGPAGMAR